MCLTVPHCSSSPLTFTLISIHGTERLQPPDARLRAFLKLLFFSFFFTSRKVTCTHRTLRMDRRNKQMDEKQQGSKITKEIKSNRTERKTCNRVFRISPLFSTGCLLHVLRPESLNSQQATFLYVQSQKKNKLKKKP